MGEDLTNKHKVLNSIPITAQTKPTLNHVHAKHFKWDKKWYKVG
jgi:hypothetical protein